VARAAAEVDFAAERVQVYGVGVIPKFEESLKLLRRGFELGEMELLDVLVARGRFLELQREALAAYAEYFRSVARLEAEIGTEIWPDEQHQDAEHGAGAPAAAEEETP
jgi:outer membrane protein TolC